MGVGYEVLGKLADGGMAEIFLARATGLAGLERYCVLKRVHRDHARDPRFIRMFLDEARLAAQLQHPNIASVYDVGELDGAYYFTMEFVHGETLREIAKCAALTGRPIPVPYVLAVIAGAAAGLHHAHERKSSDGRPLGIVHRDLTPANVMISREGIVKVVDFGVAKATDRAVQTSAGTLVGTLGYCSPEQCRGLHVDRRSDLFALGVIMWELLADNRLYDGDTDFETMNATVHDAVPDAKTLPPSVPSEVGAIAVRLLAKSPDDRYQTGADVVHAIETAAAHAGLRPNAGILAKLAHDLFGPRLEPWLSSDYSQGPFETFSASSVTTPPFDLESAETVVLPRPHAEETAPPVSARPRRSRKRWAGLAAIIGVAGIAAAAIAHSGSRELHVAAVAQPVDSSASPPPVAPALRQPASAVTATQPTQPAKQVVKKRPVGPSAADVRFDKDGLPTSR